MTVTLSWLQISDIHFSKDNNAKGIKEALVHFLKGKNPDFVFFTGDIAQAGKKEDYEQSSLFLQELTNIGIKKENIFVIPGNHDSEWGRNNFQIVLTTKEMKTSDKPILEKFYSPFENYNLWCKTFFDNDLFTFNLEHPFYFTRRRVNDFDVVIVGLNTALNSYLREKGPTIPEQGRIIIGKQIVENLLQKLGNRHENEIWICLGHHPLEWLSEDEVYNQVANLIRSNFDFYLRGHMHFQAVERIDKNLSGSYGWNPFVNISAGAIQQSENRIFPNSINMVSLKFSRESILSEIQLCPFFVTQNEFQVSKQEQIKLNDVSQTNVNIADVVQPFYTISIDERDKEIDKLNELQRAISGGTEIGQKFLYWDPAAARTWAKICADQDYKLHVSMLTTTKGIVNWIEGKSKNGIIFDFINLGVGGGEADRTILTRLLEVVPENNTMMYIPIDQSLPMLQYAVQVASQFGRKKVRVTPILADFLQLNRFKDKICEISKHQKIYGLLGGTLGNFREDTILEPIIKTMNLNDYLIIGVGLIPNENEKSKKELEEELTKSYSIESIKKFMINPICSSITSMDEINNEDKIRITKSLQDQEVRPKIERNISQVKNSETVSIYLTIEGRKLRYFYSTRYSIKELRTHLEGLGLETKFESYAADKESVSIILQKVQESP